MGDDTDSKCIECKEGFLFINESIVPSQNCFKKCEHYFYFNESNIYKCTELNICPIKYN